MLDPHRRQSGRLVFFQNEDQKAKSVVFYDAFCVHYECRFDARGRDGHGSFEVEIHLSAAAKEVQGQFSEAHSVIPWAADKDTRYRALTKPAEYLPSAALAAYRGAPEPSAAIVPSAAPTGPLPTAAPPRQLSHQKVGPRLRRRRNRVCLGYGSDLPLGAAAQRLRTNCRF